jgi:hypothetical protein
MAKLKLSAVPDDRPVKLTVELPATVHRDLVAYAELLVCQNGHKIEPAKLARKNLCNNTHTERAGAIRVVENINSVKLCLSLFAVRLEMLDLST